MAQQQATHVWIWDPVDNNSFIHPGENPNNDEALAKQRFVEKVCGPRIARLSKAKLLDRKGTTSMVAREDGSNHEVPMSRVLPWIEGLLVLQEIEDSDSPPAWFTDHFREILEKERIKYAKSVIPGALYVERKLTLQAVTGAKYDLDDHQYNFRREKVNQDEPIPEATDEELAPGFWKIHDITGYMPPWEAFCHQKCGLYQDFYQVRWDRPFLEADYSRVENGCVGVPGATWEPDECLPPHLDALRVREKKLWAKKRKEQELLEVANKAAKRSRSDASLVDSSSPQADKPPPKMARYRRDGKLLIPDMFRSKIGHDFAPEAMDDRSSNIRVGWPRKAEEYPEGFGCAAPPGFCLPGCDCMDDQRPQKPWETVKNWLEDPQRSSEAQASIEHLSAQQRFVRRRGQDHTQTRAAYALAQEVELQIKTALKDVPLSALMDATDQVRIPAVAYLKSGEDYAPVRFELSPTSTARAWATIGPEDGLLKCHVAPATRPATVQVELHYPEACSAVLNLLVTSSERPAWRTGTAGVVAKFQDVQTCPLARNARIVLQEHLSKVYNFDLRAPKEVLFGQWLGCMELLLRMLRSLAMANVVKPEGLSKPPPRAALAR
ncbi:unnamed protein product [Effrenium voratum]|uniref:Uncharacterized protein n=1 Tax=Effrenium voratum TaxID=2562239 RepID=A0AA36J179_9DINO|nr:unnamed protein product [Effrenium voratum]